MRLCFLAGILFGLGQQAVRGEVPQDGLAEGPEAMSAQQWQCDCGCFDSRTPTEPRGDMLPRLPYETFGFYYYRRPYSPGHIGHHQMEAQSAVSLPSQPYAASSLQKVYRDVERRALDKNEFTASGSNVAEGDDRLRRDRALEFVDWRRYRSARLRWEGEQAPSLQTRD